MKVPGPATRLSIRSSAASSKRPLTHTRSTSSARITVSPSGFFHPDAIFATGYYPEAAIIVRQARELGMTMPILGGDGWVGDALKNASGVQAIRWYGVYEQYTIRGFFDADRDDALHEQRGAEGNVDPCVILAHGAGRSHSRAGISLDK